MESSIVTALDLEFPPVALVWTDEKPEGAVQFKRGAYGCVVWLVTMAAKGKTAVCDADTCGCFGGAVGMGFGNQYVNVPGGMEGFCRFLSSGNDGWEQGRAIAEEMRPHIPDDFYDNYVHGERYFRSPEQVERFVEGLPMREIPARYVLCKPIDRVDRNREAPRVIVLFADPDQISALVVLANYSRGDNENVIIPYAAGCQTMGIYPYREGDAARPRAVVGLTDVTVRRYIRKQLGENLLTFAVPLALFDEMEANVPGSFLERPVWRELMEERRKARAASGRRRGRPDLTE
jgi:uncharacterized protein (DUF169 family)